MTGCAAAARLQHRMSPAPPPRCTHLAAMRPPRKGCLLMDKLEMGLENCDMRNWRLR